VRLVSYVAALLQALAVAGLLIAPLARPVMAMPASMPAAMAADHHAGASAAAMPDDMPCCPDETPTSDCAKVCPLTALCSVTISQNVPAAIVLAAIFGPARTIIPGDDAALDSIARGPPRKPPKA
jgi:hypothetical protein